MKRNRRNTLLWMKDLARTHVAVPRPAQWASDGETESFLADALIGDLNECQKLCEQLRAGKHMNGGHGLVAT